MKNKLISAFVALLVLAPCVDALTFSGSEVHITKDGTATVSGAKVMQLAGSTFYTRLYWGDAFVRLLVKTTNTTKFYRGTGEVTNLSEVSVGNLLDLSGELESGSENLVLVASTVKNSSVQKEQTTISGKVTSVDLSSQNFTLNSSKLGAVTVTTSMKTTFTKGSRTLDLAHIKVGDTITKTVGDYDLSTKTLVASSVLTYSDPNYYKPQNFQGTLQALSLTTLPTSVTVMIGNISYAVNLTVGMPLLNKNRDNVLLSRFVPGDTVRIFGTIREIDDPIIDAQVIRNMNL